MDRATIYKHLMANYQFQTSNYALYIFDHFLTFSDEVEKIWSQPINFATSLFYLNRYVTHIQFIISNVSYYETTWPICNRFVKFDGGSTLALVTVAETIMILRVYALYHANKWILALLFSILSGQIIVSAWGIHDGMRVPLPPGFPGCVLTGTNTWIAALWGAPMVTDTCIFSLTLWKAMQHRRSNGPNKGRLTTVQIILRDGIMYYFVIFSLNFMNVLIYFLAAEDIKAMGAGVSQILTAIMINRLQLNLRRKRSNSEARPVDTPVKFNNLVRGEISTTAVGGGGTELLSLNTFFTVGDLGEELEGSFFDSSAANDEEDVKADSVQGVGVYDEGAIDIELQNRGPMAL